MAAIGALPALAALNLTLCTGLTDAHIDALIAPRPRALTLLVLSNCGSVSDGAVAAARRALPPGALVERNSASPAMLQACSLLPYFHKLYVVISHTMLILSNCGCVSDAAVTAAIESV
jgi:hypothetical protein